MATSPVCSTSGRSCTAKHYMHPRLMAQHLQLRSAFLRQTAYTDKFPACHLCSARGQAQRRVRRKLARLLASAQLNNSLANGAASAPGLREDPASRQRPGGPGRPPQQQGPSVAKVLWNRVLRRLSSLPLAIGELALIAVLSAVGTIIEQNKPLEYYMKNYPDGPSKVLGFVDWRLLQTLQWDHIYIADYFLALMALLAASLAACTTTRQWPAVRIARRWRFAHTPERVYTSAREGCASLLPQADVRDLGAALTKKGYHVFLERAQGSSGAAGAGSGSNGTTSSSTAGSRGREGASSSGASSDGWSMYAFKGLAGKLGPIGVHASMLAVMAGVAIGGLCGLKGAVMVPEGGDFIFEQALAPKSPAARPPASAQSMLHVNSFEIRYRDDGSVEQFVSDLSVFDPDGREAARKAISVNDPLRYQGITAYQTDYSMAALTVRASGSPLQPPDGSAFNLPMATLEGNKQGIKGKLWATFIPAQLPQPGAKPKGASVVARDFQTVVLYNSDGSFAGVRRPGSGKPIEVEGMSITVDAIVGSTGLELKVDPGVPYVYAGFAGLMITTLVSYLSHSQVWALQTESSLHVGGRTNRALFTFGQELDELLAGLPERPLLPALALQPSPDVIAAGEQPTALAEQTSSSSVH